MRPSRLVLALSAAGLLALALADPLLQPPLVPIADLGASEGARVRVEGRLARPARGPALLQDEHAQVPLFLPRGEAPPPGAEVTALGVVVRAGGAYAVDAQRVDVRQQEAPLDACALTRAAPRYSGTPVNVTGVAAREGGEWSLVHGRCHLAFLPAGARPAEGEAGVAHGWLAYDEQTARYRLEVSAWSRRPS